MGRAVGGAVGGSGRVLGLVRPRPLSGLALTVALIAARIVWTCGRKAEKRGLWQPSQDRQVTIGRSRHCLNLLLLACASSLPGSRDGSNCMSLVLAVLFVLQTKKMPR